MGSIQRIYIYMYFFLFMAAPVAYENSQARSQMGAVPEAYTTATATPDLSCICDLFSVKCLFFFFFFLLFRPPLMAYGGFQARGGIRAVAVGLRHSHSKAGSESHV